MVNDDSLGVFYWILDCISQWVNLDKGHCLKVGLCFLGTPIHTCPDLQSARPCLSDPVMPPFQTALSSVTSS